MIRDTGAGVQYSVDSGKGSISLISSHEFSEGARDGVLVIKLALASKAEGREVKLGFGQPRGVDQQRIRSCKEGRKEGKGGRKAAFGLITNTFGREPQDVSQRY